jgi:hypothetical protein
LFVTAAVEMDGSKAETPVEFPGGHRSFRPVNLLNGPAHSGEEKYTARQPVRDQHGSTSCQVKQKRWIASLWTGSGSLR